MLNVQICKIDLLRFWSDHGPKGGSMWQKNGKGVKYKGHYMRDNKYERIMVLVGFKSNGEAHMVTAESWQMLKKAGWKKVK